MSSKNAQMFNLYKMLAFDVKFIVNLKCDAMSANSYGISISLKDFLKFDGLMGIGDTPGVFNKVFFVSLDTAHVCHMACK